MIVNSRANWRKRPGTERRIAVLPFSEFRATILEQHSISTRAVAMTFLCYGGLIFLGRRTR